MDKSEKEMMDMFPDASRRRGRNKYSDHEYMYGDPTLNIPDNQDFKVKVGKDTWRIIAMSLALGLIATAVIVWLITILSR